MGCESAFAGRLNSMGGAASDARNGHIVSATPSDGTRNSTNRFFMVVACFVIL